MEYSEVMNLVLRMQTTNLHKNVVVVVVMLSLFWFIDNTFKGAWLSGFLRVCCRVAVKMIYKLFKKVNIYIYRFKGNLRQRTTTKRRKAL